MAEPRTQERIVGRYALYGEIASGGMATVHFGRLMGPVGFSRTVAIKRLHAQFAKDPEFAAMFLDEARLAARIQHPNVVATLDVVALDGELFLVMEYVQGESFARILRWARDTGMRLPPAVVATVLSGVLHGLHAAHEATDERGMPLGIVHRDISPQNMLIGSDGVPRVFDFGVAKAAGRLQTTREGQIKGKLSYMAPEQLNAAAVDRRTDIFGAGVVLWEALTNRRLFDGETEGAVLGKLLGGCKEPPSAHAPDLPRSVDAIALRALARRPEQRFATARELAVALEEIFGVMTPRQLGDWINSVAGDSLAQRAERVKEIEIRSSSRGAPAVAADAHDTAPDAMAPAAPAPAPLPSKGRRGGAILAGVLGTAGLLAAGYLAGSRSPEPAIAAARTAEPPATSREQPPAPTAVPAPAPIAASASPEPTAAAEAPPSATSPRASAPKPKAAQPQCSPPYTIDAAGIRRLKPGCL
jgi:serine/threonine-protein kinase